MRARVTEHLKQPRLAVRWSRITARHSDSRSADPSPTWTPTPWAATLARASGAGHEDHVQHAAALLSIAITADIYTGVLPQVAREAAEGIVPRKVASVGVMPDRLAIEDHPRLGLTSGSQTMIHNVETENEDAHAECKKAGRDESLPASLEYAARDSNPGPAD